MPWQNGQALVGTLTAGAILGFFGLLLRLIGPWRKQISDAEERIRAALEASLEKEREAHSMDLERERLARAAEARQFALERDEMGDRLAKLESDAARKDRMHEAEVSLYRHQLANIRQCFDSLLILLKANPDRVKEAVQIVEEMRANQLVAEAQEKAIIHAAEIGAASEPAH
jgi:hypothetical protein